MLVVFTTHLGDRHLAVPLCEHIRRLGGVKTHECLIVSPFGTPMQGIEDVLRGAFGAVHVHQYAASLKGWPCGANEAAEAAMLHVAANPALLYHYLMMEPDCVPASPEWLNRIDVDYRRVGQGVMGTRIATQEMAPPHRQVGWHTIGVAVYPKNFAHVCPLVRGLSAMSLGYQAQNVLAPPWDAYIGAYTVRMLTETRLIQHLARQMEQTPEGLRFDCPSLEHALRQVRGDAVMIHGSKHPAFLPAIIKNYQLYATEKRNGQPEPEHLGNARGEALPEGQESPRESASGQNGSGRSLPRQQETPITTETYARHTYQEGDRQDLQSHNGDAAGTEVPKGSQEIRHADAGQTGHGRPKADVLSPKEAKKRAKDLAKLMAIRDELGVEEMPGTPEWVRMQFLYFDNKMTWHTLRSYATKLEVFSSKLKKGALVSAIIRKEKEQRKEPWTKKLPKAECVSGLNVSVDPGHTGEQEPDAVVQAPQGRPEGSNPSSASPPLPVEDTPPIPPNSLPTSRLQTTVAWGSVANGVPVNDRPAEIGPSMQEKMRALATARMAQF